jgi:hypothetical protein
MGRFTYWVCFTLTMALSMFETCLAAIDCDDSGSAGGCMYRLWRYEGLESGVETTGQDR